MIPFFSKRNPEKDVQALAESLRALLGEQLESVILFGSLASGDFNADRSDVNVLIVMHTAYDTLAQMGPALRVWLKKGHTPPVLTTLEELPGFARSFPIEFLDMLGHHRVVFGKDPIAGLPVDKKHLHAQCEHDLAVLQLKLRRAVAVASGDEKRLRRALTESVPSILTLLRAMVHLEGDGAGLTKVQIAQRLSERLNMDLVVVREIAEWHVRRAMDNVQDLTARYLNVIAAALTYLRKK